MLLKHYDLLSFIVVCCIVRQYFMKEGKVKNELEQADNISIIALVDALIEEAHEMRASDIHIDPHERDIQVRMRIDGVLQDAYSFPKEIQSEIISRIKVLAGLRTDEHQTPQDGRFRIVLDDTGPVDIRVSIAPAYYGENAVLRLLSERTEKLSLEVLGLSESDRKKIESAIRMPYGMILATGPTGSGKTTTLYTVLKALNTKEVSIITIEDPIEYAIEGINQIQVNSQTGLTFANGLRSVLRQDPDIIMVGEIRDPETAGLAVNTALTGHLMLSTLHTNDAATTLPRLLDLGMEPYLITTTVNIVIGQRLVRKICKLCKKSHKLTDNEKANLATLGKFAAANIPDTMQRGAGCDECLGSGYRGRVGIYEVMVVDDAIREAMLERCSAANIKKMAIERGMSTMVEDGFKKALAGITTPEEVLRVIHE
jgi:type II secretory ATPase GspE/PulE/Tfp pilus assembly ATPase PilB-like protein